jgi:hypothetical protein
MAGVRASGRVLELVVTREGATLMLDNDPANGPKDNRWLLPSGHSNFNALYSLALAAAANRWILVVRIAGNSEIDPNAEAEVARMGVRWSG